MDGKQTELNEEQKNFSSFITKQLLWRRALAKGIDMVIILCAFVALGCIFSGEEGLYQHTNGDKYLGNDFMNYIVAAEGGCSTYGFYDVRLYPEIDVASTSQFVQSMVSYFCKHGDEKSKVLYMNADIRYTSIFLLLNMVYVFIFDLLLKGTVGKYILGLRVYDSYGGKICFSEVLGRGLVIAILLCIFIFLRFLLETDYIVISIGFFVFVYFSVLFKKKSIVDILTNTMVDVRKQSE